MKDHVSSSIPGLRLLLTQSHAVPMPDEYVAAQASLLEPFRKADPNVNGSIGPEESVKAQLEVVGKLDQKLSCLLVSHHGDKNWF